MLAKITINPTLDIETLEWLPRPSYLIEENKIPLRFDRSVQKAAGNNATTANSVAGQAGSNAAQIGSSLIPGLESEAQNPIGLTPIQKNNALVSGAQAIGGVNSGIKGEADLAAARTRNAGGFTNALDEAARIKSRQQSANTLGVENEDARLANEKQQFAQRALQGLYGTDTSRQLEAMGLSNQDLQTKLQAGKSGWLQNFNDTLSTIEGGAKVAFPKGLQG
jgi:hypothetical protein